VSDILKIDPSWSWIKRIQKGDVLKSGSGVFRVVRYVAHHGPSLGKTSVYFTIRHPSWTGRPYTAVNGSDLRTFGYSPTHVRLKLNKEFDKKLEEDFQAPNTIQWNFRAADVRGIP
jgi:hypothetical protein